MRKKYLYALKIILLCANVSADNSLTRGVYFALSLHEASGGYQVLAFPTVTPEPDLSISGQVTIKVPHGESGGQRFQVTNLENHIEGIHWLLSSRSDAPIEDPSSDYLSFTYTLEGPGNSASLFNWEENKPLVLFGFRNGNPCIDHIKLMESTDPFNFIFNSENTNPGSQFTNLGWGTFDQNHYLGNKGESAPCPI